MSWELKKAQNSVKESAIKTYSNFYPCLTRILCVAFHLKQGLAEKVKRRLQFGKAILLHAVDGQLVAIVM